MMFTNKQPCCGTFTGRNHTTWIFGDAAEVMCTSVIITNVGKKQFTTKSHSRLWHRPNPKFTTFVLAGVSLTNTHDITHIVVPSYEDGPTFYQHGCNRVTNKNAMSFGIVFCAKHHSPEVKSHSGLVGISDKYERR